MTNFLLLSQLHLCVGVARTFQKTHPGRGAASDSVYTRKLKALLKSVLVSKALDFRYQWNPKTQPGLCSPAWKRRGTRTGTLLKWREEGQVYFISTDYLARHAFLSFLALEVFNVATPSAAGLSPVLLVCVQGSGTHPVLGALVRSSMDSKPLSWAQRGPAFGKTILRHILAIYPFISSHRCTWWHSRIQNDLLMTGKSAPLNISQSKLEVIEAGSLPSILLARPGK